MSRTKLQTNDITIGKALSWAAYDQGGILLLKKGYVVQNQRQLDILLERGLYPNKSAEKAAAEAAVVIRRQGDSISPLVKRI